MSQDIVVWILVILAVGYSVYIYFHKRHRRSQRHKCENCDLYKQCCKRDKVDL